jgi:NAD(P)-dependent dehydrogenase (short-subunit alcohol dehydrogenase family)
MIGVNLTGVMNCMRAQLQYLIRPGGSIVNVSSVAGLVGMPKVGAYAAAKAGIIGLTKTAAVEYGAEGIRVNAVCPYIPYIFQLMSSGPIDTPIFRNAEKTGVTSSATFAADTLLARIGEASEVAEVLMFLLSDKSSYITGGILYPTLLTNSGISCRWRNDGKINI